MIRNLNIQCPRCHSTCELFLSTNAPVVILNCPNCWAPMLHNENGVFALSQRQISDIVKKGDFSIERLMEKVTHGDTDEIQYAAAHTGLSVCHSDSSCSPSKTSPHSVLRSAITSDDIIDLRIVLETCHDSQELITRL